MSRVSASASVLVGCLILAVAVSAGAGVPDPDASYVTMTNEGKGLTTCPIGDGPPYRYITVTALYTDLTPMAGVPSNSFFFTVTGPGSGNVVISAVDAQTDAGGVIRFEAQGTGTVLYTSLTIQVQIYTVVLTDSDLLWCNTFDYNNNGVVDPADLGHFAYDFFSTREWSDFDWSGYVTPVDLSMFAAHYGHR